jgi:hypothetical protein
MDRVAFEAAGHLLQVDGGRAATSALGRCRAQHRAARRGHRPDPASLPERNTEPMSELGRSLNPLHDRGDQAVTGELQRVIVATGVLQQANDSRAVAPVHSRPQGRSRFQSIPPCEISRYRLEQWLTRCRVEGMHT